MQDYSLLSPLIERGNTVYFVCDLPQRRVVEVSHSYQQVLSGFGIDPMADLSQWVNRLHPDDWEYLRQQLATTQPGDLINDKEVRATWADGSTRWLCVQAGWVVGPAGQTYLSGQLQDVTATKKVALNAQKFNTKKDATLEILSHDLAAPLVNAQQLSLLLKDILAEQASAEIQQVLQLLERTCSQGVALIRDFVDNEFMESANVDLKRERADLGAWLLTIMEEYQRSTWHTHLHFEYAPPAEPMYVELDINKFQQVINNLISNAIKFTPDKGCITLQLMRQGQQAIVTVADNGVGIPVAMQSLLFDKFTKARRPGIRGEKTTGLGMSIIRTIVELHQGDISFESHEGHGSKFIVRIPALPE